MKKKIINPKLLGLHFQLEPTELEVHSCKYFEFFGLPFWLCIPERRISRELSKLLFGVEVITREEKGGANLRNLLHCFA